MSEDIRHVKSGDFVTAEITSAPTKALEKRLLELENKIRGLTENPTSSINFTANGVGTDNFVLKDKLSAEDVELYDAVYYDRVDLKYKKALAKIKLVGGSFQTGESSFVVGLVISKTNTNIDILTNGILEHLNSTQLTGLIQSGEVFRQGTIYYLSALEEGKLTRFKPNLAITVLTSGESELFVNKNYSYAEALESSGSFELGMRPLGKFTIIENKPRLVGFPGLEYSSPNWVHTDDSVNVSLRSKGFIIADLDLNEEPAHKDLWLQLELDADGEVHIMLTTGKPNGFIWQNDEADNYIIDSVLTSLGNDAELDTVTGGNYTEEQTAILYDGTKEIGTFSFKFTAAPGARRLVIFKIPESFQGWKEINTYDDGIKYGIVDDKLHSYALDYDDFDRPAETAHMYYNSKAEHSWGSFWPPKPLDNAAVLENGIELVTSKLNKKGDLSDFENAKYIIGVSDKTVYWASPFRLTQPYDYRYRFYSLISEDSNDYEDEAAKFSHLPGAGETFWHWWEDVLGNEQFINVAKGYSNRRNSFFSSSRVMGIAGSGSIEITDLISGETADPGEILQGNLLISSTSDPDHISQITGGVDLKPTTPATSPAVEIFKNNTGGTVVVTNIIFVTTEYEGTANTLNQASTVEVALGTSNDIGSTKGLDENIMLPTKLGLSTATGAAVLSGTAMATSKFFEENDKIWLRITAGSTASIIKQKVRVIVKGVIV